MTIVREVADALSLLRSVVEDTRSIVKAVNDGREYLARKHPDANKDFAKLLEQMQVTVEGLAEATGVVVGFRFTLGSEYAEERDLARFNEYVVQQRREIQRLRGQIRKLKGDCTKIRELRDSLNDHRRNDRSWSSMFGLLGLRKSPAREKLASAISNFYADDLRMIELIQQILRLAQKALSDVNRSLGERGTQYAFNVPTAAEMLGVYSLMFDEPQQQLNDLVDSLHDAVVELE